MSSTMFRTTDGKEIIITIDLATAQDLQNMLFETGEYIAEGAHFEVPKKSMARLIDFYTALVKTLA